MADSGASHTECGLEDKEGDWGNKSAELVAKMAIGGSEEADFLFSLHWTEF